MAGAARSLLAPWVGGASAPVATGARRSLAAPWLGGASAPAAPALGGSVRGLLGFWAGGAVAAPPAAIDGSVRSLLAPWLGGAAAGAGVPPQPPDGPVFAGGWFLYPWERKRKRLTPDDRCRRRIVSQREELETLIRELCGLVGCDAPDSVVADVSELVGPTVLEKIQQVKQRALFCDSLGSISSVLSSSIAVVEAEIARRRRIRRNNVAILLLS